MAVVERRRASIRPFLPVFSVNHDSPVVGGQIGLQHQFGQFVVGVEGSLTTSYQNNHASTTLPRTAYSSPARRAFDDVLTIGPRLGYAMGKWMPYITGGYANASLLGEGVDQGVQQQSLSRIASGMSGWFIGGGVDMALSHGWTVGLEYRHYDFDDALYSVTRTLAGGVIDTSQPSNFKPTCLWTPSRFARAGSSVGRNGLCHSSNSLV